MTICLIGIVEVVAVVETFTEYFPYVKSWIIYIKQFCKAGSYYLHFIVEENWGFGKVNTLLVNFGAQNWTQSPWSESLPQILKECSLCPGRCMQKTLRGSRSWNVDGRRKTESLNFQGPWKALLVVIHLPSRETDSHHTQIREYAYSVLSRIPQ